MATKKLTTPIVPTTAPRSTTRAKPSRAAITNAVQWILTVAPTARPTGSENLSMAISCAVYVGGQTWR